MTFHNVDTAIGLHYNITIPGKEVSENFVATTSQCHDDDYRLVVCEDMTALDEPTISTQTKKQLLDGQLIIIHNGITYNVLGGIVK